MTSDSQQPRVHVLDYGAGNVRSLANAVNKLGFDVKIISSPSEILDDSTRVLIFPGVGSFGSAIKELSEKGLLEPLREYLIQGRAYFGICLGMQILFSGSEESPGSIGLGILDDDSNGDGISVQKFSSESKSVPHMGWNKATLLHGCNRIISEEDHYYFVHSFAAKITDPTSVPSWAYALTRYRNELFVSAVNRGLMCATQFHPEKSGKAGLELLYRFLTFAFADKRPAISAPLTPISIEPSRISDALTVRIVACLDVRANDHGQLVVTKGDQYAVREKESGQVRNLGDPALLAREYYDQGADEIAILNITSFRNCPLTDLPMIAVLEQASKEIFVPLTIGGGIRDCPVVAGCGISYSAVEIADIYFRSGADKVSIGSDAVYAAEAYWANGKVSGGQTSIEMISEKYGRQAVVVSIDPRRVYVDDTELQSFNGINRHMVIKTNRAGPNGERHCWFQCTVKGGREGRDLDVVALVRACEALGAGELLLNSMDRDGSKDGYDLELIQLVKENTNIPVIASSGAGKPEHFKQAFEETGVEAALAAGIFHRKECPIADVKRDLAAGDLSVRFVG